MALGIYPALFFTVALLVTSAYFLLGGLPLLVLQHDTALDARFIRGFFNVYFKAALFTAGGACLGYALWGRWGFAAGTAGLIGAVLLLRRQLLPAMQHIGERIQHNDQAAIRHFRRVHGGALLFNLAQLVLVVAGILHLSL